MNSLTPKQIVAELDKYIIGQDEAKRAVAVAVRNRWRRLQLPESMAAEVGPKNILMIGPTGVGKTEIARRLARLVNAPFVKVEASRYTEVGYHGRDVESMVRDLLDLALNMVREEQTEVVREQAERVTEERLLDHLLPGSARIIDDPNSPEAQQRHRNREKFRQRLRAGEFDDRDVEIVAEEKAMPMGMMATFGMDQLDPEIQNFFEKLIPQQQKNRRLPLREARKVLFQQACDQLIDREKVTEMAIRRTENNGIIFIDEIDKIASTGSEHGPDVSRQGVQRDLLPIVEGSTVNTRHGPVRTDHILFIAAGAFHVTKPSDLMPELQGRFPIRVELSDLTKEDFIRILTQPQNAITRQQVALMATEGVKLEFTPDAIDAMAEIAYQVNRTTLNIGARRLYTIVEKVLETLSFEAPDRKGESIVITGQEVRERLADITKDEDLSRFIL
ncbi:MAG TPA: ATP-dependent protease ATPase subunit HslU [Phycisphaerae bacterium]|jgi:ATP-dependent HslUV protease ATP-binding subunit HslU|nr:ATP-dependent protease ATPase subunit HslU [Phycisphaerae bacterium]HOB74798.1 ATP-dependent protease ATPase subunit HslU [Phycisphaerae bacterium]HOJ54367.1 ATP-dependent protease ATPase subunit HslU [Phycisphaerae bacterium]HOL26838.1 ATP-dependent protease ATPase subunit HslU [Phycisphaerae bacterium]HPP19999.1 ATP-dependent protease ATPase subunit HslU [Phycisphaerae bacterium]